MSLTRDYRSTGNPERARHAPHTRTWPATPPRDYRIFVYAHDRVASCMPVPPAAIGPIAVPCRTLHMHATELELFLESTK